MKFKLLVIFLSLFCFHSSFAKPAPKNTFKLDDSSNDIQLHNKDLERVELIQDKIRSIESQKADNFIFKKINEIRLKRLKQEL